MRRYLHLYRVITKTFGYRLRPLGAFALLQVRQAISATTLGLDHLVYPRHRKQAIDRPIFIIGNPRSGTTFLHRLLLGAGDMAAFELWEMLFPAITARKLLGRIVPRLDRLSPARYHSSDVHDTSLRGIETDDVAWFFRTLDGPFAWAYFLAWQDTWGSELSRREFGIDGVTPSEDERFFHYYEACWRRNLTLKRANRILIKSSMLTFGSTSCCGATPTAGWSTSFVIRSRSFRPVCRCLPACSRTGTTSGTARKKKTNDAGSRTSTRPHARCSATSMTRTQPGASLKKPLRGPL